MRSPGSSRWVAAVRRFCKGDVKVPWRSSARGVAAPTVRYCRQLPNADIYVMGYPKFFKAAWYNITGACLVSPEP